MDERRSRGTAGAVSPMFLALISCIAGADDPTGVPQREPIGQTQQALLLQAQAVWVDPDISVCWEDLRQSTAEQRSWVQAAVEAAYESISPLDFSGWGPCGPGGGDVVIHVGEDVFRPYSLIGARSASLQPSMWLNFREQACGAGANCREPLVGYTGRVWPSIRQAALELDAVHEFAHVLGFGHEMDRTDTPFGCDATHLAGSEQMLPMGYWDLTSVTNYCNPALDNDGRLSPLDVFGVQALYGEQERAILWQALGNVRDYGSASVDLVNFAISGRSARAGLSPVAGDFDGDGAADLFWYDPAGTAQVWWNLGDGSFDPPAAQRISTGYQPFSGDFNGDGRADLFLYSPSGNDMIWWGGIFDHSFNQATREAFGPGYTPVAGDFDGDGRDDVYWYNPNGTSKIGWSNGNGSFFYVNTFPGSGLRPFAGDFDGDGDDDLFLFHPTGVDVMWKANGAFRLFSELNRRFAVVGNYTPAVGDFDGDGIDDIAWNGAGATDQLWLMRTPIGSMGTAIVTNTAVGQSTNVFEPAPTGDFNGDGLDDILWYDED